LERSRAFALQLEIVGKTLDNGTAWVRIDRHD
jgi:hypothetical protein